MKGRQIYKRRREGKTYYQKRINLLLSRLPRLVVRFTNKHIICQIVEYGEKGDFVKATVFDNKNQNGCQKAGVKIGEKAKELGVKKMIFDLGLGQNKPRVIACARGVLSTGADVPFSFDEDETKDEEKVENKAESEAKLKVKSPENKAESEEKPKVKSPEKEE
ncbi:MAG: hypothetical protein CVU81_01555 [Euryarchaeota archaeon HGW-Euryarchaeota-1]|nr:MAG: hypothetical protein CVU81_01555 [Euryarchaeota archaeon HGW-Euryarchaeota-1]